MFHAGSGAGLVYNISDHCVVAILELLTSDCQRFSESVKGVFVSLIDHLWSALVKLKRDVIKLCYFPFAVVIILSRLFFFFMSRPTVFYKAKTKHSFRSSCFIKKSAFNVAGTLVMVAKFTFQSVSNSRRNLRRFSARGLEESLEPYSVL